MTADAPSNLIPLGHIVRLQIHLERMESKASLYDSPSPQNHMMQVDALRCDRRGVCGVMGDGSLQRDIHHKDHPVSRYRGANDISLMPLGHYTKIRQRFGEHMVDGIVGENVLVSFDDVLTMEDLAGGIVIGDGENAFAIDSWRVATPCTPFSRLAAGIPLGDKPDRRVTEALQFLNNGMRGFYGDFPDHFTTPVEIRPGDPVYLRKA